MNCTKRVTSRVKRKKIATIPTMPRNNGPNRPCRYVTRPCVLKATGAAAVVRLVNIKSPFRDQMTILSGSRQATETGRSEADIGSRPQADAAGTELLHAA